MVYSNDTIGLPPGVCNVVFGTGSRAGQAIVTHPRIPVVSFTGSTAVGQKIQTLCAPYCKKLSLEVYRIENQIFFFSRTTMFENKDQRESNAIIIIMIVCGMSSLNILFCLYYACGILSLYMYIAYRQFSYYALFVFFCVYVLML